MSTSPPPATVPSTKRPLEDPSSPSAPTDLPEAKRPALDKIVKDESTTEAVVSAEGFGSETSKTEDPAAQVNGSVKEDSTVDVQNGVDAISPSEAIGAKSEVDHADNEAEAGGAPPDETSWIHIRAVISSAEAATCIGKGGENVTQIRRLSGAKCTVSDYSRGAVERILTVSGAQDAVAKVDD